MAQLYDYLKKQGHKAPEGTLTEFLERPKTKKPRPIGYTDPKTKLLYPSQDWMFSHWKTLPEVQKAYPDYGKPKIGPVQERANELTEQLGGGEYALPSDDTTTLGGKTGVGAELGDSAVHGATTPGKPTDIYDYSKIKTDYESAQTEKKSAYDEMLGLETSLYQDEYGKAGLGDIKSKIAQLDTDMTNRKSQRDQMLLDEMGKPIPQWMITGRKKLEVDSASADLNQLIDQRNTLAGQYNTGIDEVTRKVGYGVKDAGTKYAYWEGEEKRLTDLMKSYQATLAQELSEEEEAERWEKEFGLDLQKATESKTQITEVGGRKVLVNTQTGEIIKDLGAVPVKETQYTPPTSYKEWGLAGKPGTFEEWLQTGKKEPEKTPEETADEIIKKYFDYGKTREDVENLYKEAKPHPIPIPIDIEKALDKFYGKKKEGLTAWLKKEIWSRLPGVK